jgi:hypothetical protein
MCRVILVFRIAVHGFHFSRESSQCGHSTRIFGHRFVALTIYYEDLIRQGHVHDYAVIATLGHVTRARVTQIKNLRLLADDVG